MLPATNLELSGNRRGFRPMQAATDINDPAYWRQRAEEARRLGSQLNDPVAKQTMLDIARSYEQLALITRARLAPGAAE